MGEMCMRFQRINQVHTRNRGIAIPEVNSSRDRDRSDYRHTKGTNSKKGPGQELKFWSIRRLQTNTTKPLCSSAIAISLSITCENAPSTCRLSRASHAGHPGQRHHKTLRVLRARVRAPRHQRSCERRDPPARPSRCFHHCENHVYRH